MAVATVYYDGEEVTFEGDIPQTLGKLLDILQSNAISQGRALVSFKVDGQEALDSEANLLSQTYQKVEAQTVDQNELFVGAINTTVERLGDPDEVLDEILNLLLTEDWSVSFNKLNGFLQGLADYFELLANLVNYGQSVQAAWMPELMASNKTMETSFGAILKNCETQEVADLSSELNDNFRPAYIDSLNLVKGPIKASFTA